jgi:hypothetical protein
MTSPAENSSAEFRFGSELVRAVLATEFLQDARRATSSITNFGNWELPPEAADALNSTVAHLEWFHQTGELVAFGQVPYRGSGSIEVSGSKGLIDGLSGPFGGAGGSVQRAEDGSLHEVFPAMNVDADTLVAVLAVASHGPRVHERLLGWQLEHRHADGWAWLAARLDKLHTDLGDTDF